MAELLRAEVKLTIDIIAGLMLGEVIMRLGLAEKLLKAFMPFLARHKIPSVTVLALGASLGSSRAGAALIASALHNRKISERSAVWSVLTLPFPAYLKRWPMTFIMSMSLAGKAGGIFALSLLLRSALRFAAAVMFLMREHDGENVLSLPETAPAKTAHNFLRQLTRTLPAAWVCFAGAYMLVPIVNEIFRGMFAGGLLPASGWSITAASVAHMRSALALAGGSMAAGELTVPQAVFALVLGSGLGTATRILRQDAGYYFGLFEVRIARKMLLMNFITIIAAISINLFFARLALLFSA